MVSRNCPALHGECETDRLELWRQRDTAATLSQSIAYYSDIIILASVLLYKINETSDTMNVGLVIIKFRCESAKNKPLNSLK